MATTVDGEPVVVETEWRPMKDLQVGELFFGLGSDESVLEVVEAPAWAPDRPEWVWTRNRSMGPEQAEAAVARGEAESGCDPREGFYSAGQTEALIRAVRARIEPDECAPSGEVETGTADDHGDDDGDVW